MRSQVAEVNYRNDTVVALCKVDHLVALISCERILLLVLGEHKGSAGRTFRTDQTAHLGLSGVCQGQ